MTGQQGSGRDAKTKSRIRLIKWTGHIIDLGRHGNHGWRVRLLIDDLPLIDRWGGILLLDRGRGLSTGGLGSRDRPVTCANAWPRCRLNIQTILSPGTDPHHVLLAVDHHRLLRLDLRCTHQNIPVFMFDQNDLRVRFFYLSLLHLGLLGLDHLFDFGDGGELLLELHNQRCRRHHLLHVHIKNLDLGGCGGGRCCRSGTLTSPGGWC